MVNVNGMAPVYLQDLLDLYRLCRSLRSGKMQLLKTQSYDMKSYGFRAFSISAPRLWNVMGENAINSHFTKKNILKSISTSNAPHLPNKVYKIHM